MSALDDSLHAIDVARVKVAARKEASFWQGFKSALTGSELGRKVTRTAMTGIGKQLGTATMGAAAAGIIAGGASAATTGFRAVRDKLQKGKAFSSMVEANPAIKDMDAKAVQRTFNTLYSLNRDLARDPVVSGGFVSKHVGTISDVGGGGHYVDPQTALQLQRGGEMARRPGPIQEAFTSGRDFSRPAARPSARKEQRLRHEFGKKMEKKRFGQQKKIEKKRFDRQKRLEMLRARLR